MDRKYSFFSIQQLFEYKSDSLIMEKQNCRVQIEIKLFGIGKVFKFLYDNFYFVQLFFFIVSCAFFYFGLRIPMFLFLFFECFIIWCQYRAPLIDQERRENFTKWVDSAMVAEGGESCHFMNAMLEQCFEKMFPDSLSPYLCRLAEETCELYKPGFVTDLKFTAMTYGYKPPKFLQVISEQAKACQSAPNSVSMTWYCVFANNMTFQCDFKMFGIPIHLVMDDWVFYMPVQTIVESPEKNEFLNTPIITAVAFTYPEPLIVLHNNMWFNGFNFSLIPMCHYAFTQWFEASMAAMISFDEYMVWDWILNTYTFRHKTRTYSKLSEDLFKDIATLDTEKTPSYSRFSMPNDVVRRFDEKRKTDWERAYKTKVPPNEMLVMMAPPYQEENEPVFKYYEQKKPCSDVETQTENNIENGTENLNVQSEINLAQD
ncbi:hypothetical protein TRFO_12170 [Tritrichomonas foetus]|uniref:Uncharacterized protein n=1 Tax=Tritrichomonas foetus TaxID=1144522 RepID=A0A1J4J0P4_9EUKA|nr:hypothetical protein TRFO_12170 [Tritrichomonas foetus]|eukprot:OHS92978.1 hypothetical protein TRFO_12170 [Tritrichomonas foetus]